MSILIKGIDLPKKIKGQHGVDYECETYIELYIRSDGVVFDDEIEEVGQAIQIPTPHGRLIDADALDLEREVDLADDWKTAHEIANCVKYAPTILEAEE